MKAIRDRIFDLKRRDSFVSLMRRRRLELFLRMLSELPRPVRVLDVGGAEWFWRVMDFVPGKEIEIVLLNLAPQPEPPGFKSVVGDARDMREFGDGEFDVVFSNSVVEHVGTWADQQRMASEVRRVGRRYFVQTPNKFFPVDAHTHLPYFQAWPMSWRVRVVGRGKAGVLAHTPDPVEARRMLGSIRLLSGREMQKLFPDAKLVRERFLGLTKSFVAVK